MSGGYHGLQILKNNTLKKSINEEKILEAQSGLYAEIFGKYGWLISPLPIWKNSPTFLKKDPQSLKK